MTINPLLQALPILLVLKVLCVLGYKTDFPLQNSSKSLDPSYKDGSKFWDCFGWENPYKY